MLDTVFIKTLSPKAVDTREVLRYAGAKEDATELIRLIESLADSVKDVFSYKVCYSAFRILRYDEKIDLGFASLTSKTLEKRLTGCDYALVFAATVGIGIDRMVLRAEYTSPSSALLLESLGSERVEALCDSFCEEIDVRSKEAGYSITKRFSPGYGDIPLSLQKDIFGVLDAPRKIGLTLNESLIMSPKKSVSAIIGFKNIKDKND